MRMKKCHACLQDSSKISRHDPATKISSKKNHELRVKLSISLISQLDDILCKVRYLHVSKLQNAATGV